MWILSHVVRLSELYILVLWTWYIALKQTTPSFYRGGNRWGIHGICVCWVSQHSWWGRVYPSIEPGMAYGMFQVRFIKLLSAHYFWAFLITQSWLIDLMFWYHHMWQLQLARPSLSPVFLLVVLWLLVRTVQFVIRLIYYKTAHFESKLYLFSLYWF
jgi:hypothetical protein